MVLLPLHILGLLDGSLPLLPPIGPSIIIVAIQEKSPLPIGPGPQTIVPAGFFNLLIEPGATYGKTFQFFDADLTPIDLTNFDIIRSELRDKFLQDSGVVVATTVVAYQSQAIGKINFEIIPTETEKLTAEEGKWDLEVEHVSTGEVVRLLQGNWIRLRPQTTD